MKKWYIRNCLDTPRQIETDYLGGHNSRKAGTHFWIPNAKLFDSELKALENAEMVLQTHKVLIKARISHIKEVSNVES